MLSFIERLTAIEILFILAWLAIIAYGFVTGPFRQLFIIGSIVLGMVVAFAIAPPLSVWTGPMSTVGREGALPFTYAFLLGVTALVGYIIIVRTYPNTKISRWPHLDTVAGGAVGFFTGLIVITELVILIDSMTRGNWGQADAARVSIQAQTVGGPFFAFVADLFPQITEMIKQLNVHM